MAGRASDRVRVGSAMTYEFVGMLRSLTDDVPFRRTATGVGMAVGLAIEALRKWLRPRSFVLDAIVLPSPYALSSGRFISLPTSLWLERAVWQAACGRRRAPARRDAPDDTSSASLIGGG